MTEQRMSLLMSHKNHKMHLLIWKQTHEEKTILININLDFITKQNGENDSFIKKLLFCKLTR